MVRRVVDCQACAHARKHDRSTDRPTHAPVLTGVRPLRGAWTLLCSACTAAAACALAAFSCGGCLPYGVMVTGSKRLASAFIYTLADRPAEKQTDLDGLLEREGHGRGLLALVAGGRARGLALLVLLPVPEERLPLQLVRRERRAVREGWVGRGHK